MKKQYSTSIEERLIKKVKILSAMQDRKINEIFEEALEDLFKKYEKEE